MNRIERVKNTLGSTPGVFHFEVIDESHKHGAGRVGDSHLKVVVVSAAFEGMSAVARHRWVNALYKSEFETGLHALAVTARTPAEWEADSAIAASPNCVGKGT